MLHFLHLEDIGALGVLEVLLHFCLIVNLELFQSASQLLLQFVGQGRQVLVVQDGPIVHLHNDALNS